MLDQVLRHFPPHTHALTLVGDPDQLMGDEQVRAALGERGFRVIEERDPIILRYMAQRARPWTAHQPVVVVTGEPLNTLPYDLWQQSHHVELALHTFFPQLDYQVVRLLSSEQRRRLSEAQASVGYPAELLSPVGTQQYLLQTVFGITPSPSLRPADLVEWLDRYHAHDDLMPNELQRRLVADLQRSAVVSEWPLGELVASGEAYRRWVREAWSGAVQATVRETGVTYRPIAGMAFESDSALQELVPRLLRTGTLQPIEGSTSLPLWAQPAVATNDEHTGLRQFSEGLAVLEAQLKNGRNRWHDWQESAWLWARLCALRWALDLRHPFEELWRFKQLQQPLDHMFHQWLCTDYALLAGQSLPRPHHVYHVPSYLAQHRQRSGQRQALLIMDGMALADWLVVRRAWGQRHPGWHWLEGLLLAQVPSITAVSRQALISGRRPSQFADTLLHTSHEARAWKDVWLEHGVADNGAVYLHLASQGNEATADAISSRRTQALCMVSTVIDDMVHGATQGPIDVHSSLRIWLLGDEVEQPRSAVLENMIQQMLDQGWSVTITSDHGHVGAEGIGQPQDGATAVSRGKRARIYTSQELAERTQAQFPHTFVWHDDGLLPASSWILMPTQRGAFAPAGRTVVGHGGLTIEEMIVPLVTISQ